MTADVAVEPPRLMLAVVVHNRLPVDLDRVDVGALLAAQSDPIATADAGRLYARGRSSGAVTVIHRQVALIVPAGGSAPVDLSVVGAAGDVDGVPAYFQTHLLGYGIAEVRADVLTTLLATEVAADEVAAVDALAIGGTPAAKRLVRGRFAADGALHTALQELVTAPIPAAPDARATVRRVYVVLGLGIVGGDEARASLKKLAGDASLATFDEPLQVMRAAQLTGGRAEAPLAYALPAATRTMKDVVAAATADLDGWSIAGEADIAAADGEPEAQRPGTPPGRAAAGSGLGMPVAIGVGVVVFFATWLLMRRRA